MSYADYFLNSPSRIVQLETLQIAHPSFSSTKWIVRNAVNGVTCTIETSASVFFTYYPLQIQRTGIGDDLDQKITVQLGDLGELLPQELDLIAADDAFGVKPTVTYRTFRSDDLTHVLFGPVKLEVVNFSMTREGSAFDAQAPSLNINRTGESYLLDRFPMLRGFL